MPASSCSASLVNWKPYGKCLVQKSTCHQNMCESAAVSRWVMLHGLQHGIAWLGCKQKAQLSIDLASVQGLAAGSPDSHVVPTGWAAVSGLTAQGHAPRSLTCQSVDFRSAQHQAYCDWVTRSSSGHAHAWQRCIVACFPVKCCVLPASPRPAKSSSCMSPSIATLRAFNTSSLSVSPYRFTAPVPHVWRAQQQTCWVFTLGISYGHIHLPDSVAAQLS